jgi:hypothetical protein
MTACIKPEEDLVLPGVARDILATTKRLHPKKGNRFLISTNRYDLNEWGPWFFKEPSTYSAAKVQVGAQVTTGLSMEGTYRSILA